MTNKKDPILVTIREKQTVEQAIEEKKLEKDLEQQSLEHPEIDWEVKYWELAGHRWSIFIILRLGIFFFFYSLN